MERERVLILNISGIGDFVESTSALRRLRTLYPSATITMAVAEKAYPLASRCPFVDEVVALPTARGRSIVRLKDFPRWCKRLRSLRRRFDSVINLYRVHTWFGGQWIRFLVRWSGARKILDASIAHEPNPRPELWILQERIDQTKRWLQSLDAEPIAIFLGGERRTRHEQPQRAERWLSDILKRFDVHPVIIGSTTDPGLPARSTLKHTDARGKTDVEQMAAIVASSRVLITTHSAPQHFAGVWGVPTVVIVGPGDADLYRPQLEASRLRTLRHPVPCSPCYYQDCPLKGDQHQKCLTRISPEAIVQAFAELFRATKT